MKNIIKNEVIEGKTYSVLFNGAPYSAVFKKTEPKDFVQTVSEIDKYDMTAVITHPNGEKYEIIITDDFFTDHVVVELDK